MDDMGGDIMDFVQRFRSLQHHTNTSEQLIKDLLVYCETVESGLRLKNEVLSSQLNDANLDLEDARKSRRDLQQQLQQLESRLESVLLDSQHLKNHNPYVILLIDGDGLFFKENFIRQGLEGGKKAAYALRLTIAAQIGDRAESVEILARVYANLSGLCKIMRRDGSVENEADVRDFSVGFTQVMGAFDFVDVGHGKERADTKIREAAKWHLRNYNCKQVIIGGSHDAGYAPFLDETFQDEGLRRRITILEGIPTVREIVATGVNILNLNDSLFRPDKLIDRTVLRNPTPPLSNPDSSTHSTPNTAPATTATAPTTYATVMGGASPPPQISLPLAPKPGSTPVRKPATLAKPPALAWNPGARGLDPPIHVSQAALDNIKRRKDNQKLCNNHYLRGPCAKGDACCFEHRYKPTAEELIAIAFLARLNPCTSGQDCETDGCIYGHHCPSVQSGQCMHPYCKFQPSDHPPGTKFRNRALLDSAY